MNTIENKFPYKRAFLISDLHLGTRSASEEWIENISKYFNDFFIPLLKTNSKKGDCLICLGDVFDDRKNINIAVNDLAIDLFEELASIIPVYIINGNHDLYKKTNEGVTSLKSLHNIPNVTIVSEPTVFIDKEIKLGFIPYLGNVAEENRCCIEMKDSHILFMHTDISKMAYDNGQKIMNGVSLDGYEGKVYSGHIHKLQIQNNVTYVGSPYQLRRSDIGNKKGVFMIDLKKAPGKVIGFSQNDYSPEFQKIKVENFLSLPEQAKLDFLRNNYTDILIDTKDLGRYNLNEIYGYAEPSNARRVFIQVNKSIAGLNTEEIDLDSIKELSLHELIDLSIDELEEVEDKESLKALSNTYLEAAEKELYG